MPSILQTLNIKPPEQTLGKSFWPKGKLLKTNTLDYSYSELDLVNSLKSIITPQWKYIYDYADKTEYLYDIKSDPSEQNNLADTKTAQLDKLREQLFQWVSASKQYPKKIQPVQISPEEEEKLKELGYIQ
jgi:arylsulfatase A-like enzyme